VANLVAGAPDRLQLQVGVEGYGSGRLQLLVG
jgi:hypothetical protein